MEKKIIILTHQNCISEEKERSTAQKWTFD